MAELPPVPLTRLRALDPGEHALYFDLFLAAGGGPDKPVAEGAVSLLERSRLPAWLLQAIWVYADEYNTNSLDLEGFFVACRLCAHAQQATDEATAEKVAGAAAAAEIPRAPPWFEGYKRSQEGAAPSYGAGSAESLGASRMPDGSDGNGNFDFEAAAFGSGGTAGGPSDSVRPAGGAGLEAMPILPVPSAATGHRHRADAAGDPDPWSHAAETPSADALAKGLGLRRPEQAASSNVAHRRTDVKSDPAKRLGEELLEGRQKLEQRWADKRRLQRRIEKARQRLESLRSDREQVAAELTSRQCDVQHMFTQLDFSRQQIEAVEREVAHMRSVRQAFTADDVVRMERARSQCEAERDGHDRRASMQIAEDMQRQDLQHAAELTDRVKRVERRKTEIHSKQILLLEEQRQVEAERSGMLYALELERVKLHCTRSERLEIGHNSQHILKEAQKLARDTGVEPQVFAECFLPQPDPVREPLDPLVAPAAGAWGPAADHVRGWEDTSSWKNAVYRSRYNANGASGVSAGGSNVDTTWAKFGKPGGGAAQHLGRDHGGKDYSHNHYRNVGMLGVPAGQEQHGDSSSGYIGGGPI